jgi:hypothetical protein
MCRRGTVPPPGCRSIKLDTVQQGGRLYMPKITVFKQFQVIQSNHALWSAKKPFRLSVP